MQTRTAVLIDFDTPAIIQTSCEPLENLVVTHAAQTEYTGRLGLLVFLGIVLSFGSFSFPSFFSPAGGNANR